MDTNPQEALKASADFAKALETMNNIQNTINKQPEVSLLFGEVEKKAKLSTRYTPFIIEKAIDIINLRYDDPLTNFVERKLSEFKQGVKQYSDIEFAKDSTENQKKFTYEQVLNYLKEPIDKKRKQFEISKTIDLFKLILNDLKDGDDKAFETKEIELLHSEYGKGFWEFQDIVTISEAVRFFRTRTLDSL